MSRHYARAGADRSSLYDDITNKIIAMAWAIIDRDGPRKQVAKLVEEAIGIVCSQCRRWV